MEKIIPRESQEQKALFDWAQYHPICRDFLIHIPNGGYRNPREAANLKKQGVKRGVSDIFLAYPIWDSQGMHYAGLWIELKRKGGKLTVEQDAWLSMMSDQGYWAVVCYGAEDAILV